MDNARRYRLNAAECLSAAGRCDSDHRSLLFSVSAGWHALARHDEAMGDLLASWGLAWPAASKPRRVNRCTALPSRHTIGR
jgi:hypothetical protein